MTSFSKRLLEHKRKSKVAACAHRNTRLEQHASSLNDGPPFGGYYKVGVFDVTITCKDCGALLEERKAAPPACCSCYKPMACVTECEHGDGVWMDSNNGLSGTIAELDRIKQRHIRKLRRDWNKYDTRMSRVEDELERREEAEESDDQADPDDFIGMFAAIRKSQPAMTRILRGHTRQQVFPYVCTYKGCKKFGQAQFLHTPGD